jgi:nucleosome binding factor SPN SPT16 subunit
MANKEVEIKGQAFYDKIKRFYDTWDKSESDFGSFCFILGTVKDDTRQDKTSQLHLWLLSYEFSETVMTFNRKKIVVLTSNRKKQLLDEMKAPEGYKGPIVEVILRDPNVDK